MIFRSLGLFVATVAAETLIFEDNFEEFDLKRWKHEITMGGGGNWEFEMYLNQRENSFVKNGVLYLQPTLTADKIGDTAVKSGTYSLWGSSPADYCTSNAWYGCERNA